MGRFHLLWADECGEIREAEKYYALGRSARSLAALPPDSMIPLPSGSTLYLLPGRLPVGISVRSGKISPIESPPDTGYRGKALAVAAILPPGYLRTFLPAWKKVSKGYLPFNAFTAVAFRDGQIWAAAQPVSESIRWNWSQYDCVGLSHKIKEALRDFPGNRILRHLSRCAEEFHCYTAQNIFLNRWEGGIPSSPSCNASCLGCISHQSDSQGPPAPQDRIRFVPSPEEIAELGLRHLTKSEWTIVSFGQGCEGEPLLQSKILSLAISAMRKATGRGTININTNGSLPEALFLLLDSGLDSLRVSLNSAVESNYLRYFRPSGYAFGQVLQSLKAAKDKGAFLSLNLLVLPGITDGKKEVAALENLLRSCRVDMIQMRNMNIDPDLFFDYMQPDADEELGILNMLQTLKKNFPDLKIGCSSLPLKP